MADWKITHRTLTLLLLLLSLAATAKKHAVYITMGQSNAEGRETIDKLPHELRQGYRHLRFANIRENSLWKFGERQLLEDRTWSFQDIVNGLIDRTAKQDFYAIKCTYGGTAIALHQTNPWIPTWNASVEYLDTARAYRGHEADGKAYKIGNSLALAFAEGFATLVAGELSHLKDGYEVKAILWHQGESDRKAGSQYYRNLATLIAYFRDTIFHITGDKRTRHLPVIIGTVSHLSRQYNAEVEAAQLRLDHEDSNLHLIDMSQAELKADQLHFDSLSTVQLGCKMFDKLVEIGSLK